MPNRRLKESLLTSKTLAQFTTAEPERLFTRLLLMADDYGRFEAEPDIIRGRCFPRFGDRVTDEHVEAWLQQLVTAKDNPIVLYTAGERRYGAFVNWKKHGEPRAKASKFPDPPDPELSCAAIRAAARNGAQPGAAAHFGEQPGAYTPEVEVRSRGTKKEEERVGADAPTPRPELVWLERFNALTGRRYEAAEVNLRPIRARLRERHTIGEAELVVAYKVSEWGHDSKTRKWLRPPTVFGSRFPNYLVEARAAAHVGNDRPWFGPNSR